MCLASDWYFHASALSSRARRPAPGRSAHRLARSPGQIRPAINRLAPAIDPREPPDSSAPLGRSHVPAHSPTSAKPEYRIAIRCSAGRSSVCAEPPQGGAFYRKPAGQLLPGEYRPGCATRWRPPGAGYNARSGAASHQAARCLPRLAMDWDWLRWLSLPTG